ncbi:hypothetical protein OIU76_006105 [Salix suchowensis]|nr:hypothetical protein OIU76_006105 [Salix suchowensis]
MLEQKQQQGILWSPKERECLFLLQRCRTRKTLLQIHALILRNAIDANVNILTKFITTCGQLSSISHARHLFDNRSNRDDTFLCNSMIRSHVVMRQFASAFNLYKDLRRETCFVPDNFTFTVLAKCCALRMAVWEGLEMHGHVVKIGFCFDMYVSTTLVDMYAKFGNLGLARRVFNDMTDRSLVSWTALIGGYVRRGDMGNAWFLFKLMPGRDSAAFNLLIDGYVKVGDMRCARSLFDEMPERNVISWTSMIYGYCNNGDVLSARVLFDAMPEKNLSSTLFEPNEVTVVSILPAIATLGALELGEWVHQFAQKKKLDREVNVCTSLVDIEALEAFSEMQREGIKPNDITMTGVLSACSHGGLVEEGKRRFKAMIESGFSPKIEHYGCLVDLLGKGRVLGTKLRI